MLALSFTNWYHSKVISGKEKFIKNFADFIGVLTFDVPKVFFNAHPFYRAMKRARFQNRRVKQGLYNLQHRGIIKSKENGYSITEKGRKWLSRSKYRYFKINNKIWDRKWRIIMFDIPAKMERQRKAFRYKLKLIGAYMVQKSVFVFPYSCETEIGEWCQELKLSDYVDVITAYNIGSQEQFIKQHFEL